MSFWLYFNFKLVLLLSFEIFTSENLLQKKKMNKKLDFYLKRYCLICVYLFVAFTKPDYVTFYR